jgi:hypothetical protein
MNAALGSGILTTLYNTWLHNSLAIALVVGILLTAILLIMKPKRRLVFFLIGFLLLLLEFEYRKHFGKALEEQTIRAVLIEGESLRARGVLEDLFSKAVPFLLWLGGWGLVFLGVIF